MPYTTRNNKDAFEIVEKGSELVVAVRKDKAEATKMTRSLNLGSGFDGFTPTFFTLTYPDPDARAKGKAAQT
jgi:hypothetical protein